MNSLIFVLLSALSFIGPAPVVEWQIDKEHDMGLLKLNEPKSVHFVFKNISDEPITVDNVRVSCGCTAPTWDYEPIAPGEVSTIEIKFDARKPGYFYKKIKVFFSGQRKGENLSIEGKVLIE